MATGTVSACVSQTTKRISSSYIRQANMTVNEVIRNLMEYIASTGTIPDCARSAKQAAPTAEMQAFDRLMELRSRVPSGTPLATMTPAGLKEELANRDA